MIYFLLGALAGAALAYLLFYWNGDDHTPKY